MQWSTLLNSQFHPPLGQKCPLPLPSTCWLALAYLYWPLLFLVSAALMGQCSVLHHICGTLSWRRDDCTSSWASLDYALHHLMVQSYEQMQGSLENRWCRSSIFSFTPAPGPSSCCARTVPALHSTPLWHTRAILAGTYCAATWPLCLTSKTYQNGSSLL